MDLEKEISHDSLKQYAESIHEYALRVEMLATKLKKTDILMMQTFIRKITQEVTNHDMTARTLKDLVTQVSQLQSTMDSANKSTSSDNTSKVTAIGESRPK